MKRPNLNDYDLTKTFDLVDYVQAWNEYSNLLKLEINNLKFEKKVLEDFIENGVERDY